MISISGAVSIFVYLLVTGVIFWILFWALQYIGLPEPCNKVGRVVLVLLACMVAIGILLSLVGGHQIFRW